MTLFINKTLGTISNNNIGQQIMAYYEPSVDNNISKYIVSTYVLSNGVLYINQNVDKLNAIYLDNLYFYSVINNGYGVIFSQNNITVIDTLNKVGTGNVFFKFWNQICFKNSGSHQKGQNQNHELKLTNIFF